MTRKLPFQRSLPVVECKTVADYFITMLGLPDPVSRLAELDADYPLNSAVGVECVAAIDAAATLIKHLKASYGAGADDAVVRLMTLHACEVYAFG